MASGRFKAMPKCPHITEAAASLAIFLLCARRNTLLLRLTSHSYESSSVQTNLSTIHMQIVTKYDATIERFVKADRQAADKHYIFHEPVVAGARPSLKHICLPNFAASQPTTRQSKENTAFLACLIEWLAVEGVDTVWIALRPM
jgi:hypothetical protein